MDESEIAEYFDEKHVPDSVTNNAVRFAMAATEPPKWISVYDKIFTALILLFIVLSVINYVNLRQEQVTQNNRYHCEQQLVLYVTHSTPNSAHIPLDICNSK